MENTVLYDRINTIPVQVKEEVLDYMEILLEKNGKISRLSAWRY